MMGKAYVEPFRPDHLDRFDGPRIDFDPDPLTGKATALVLNGKTLAICVVRDMRGGAPWIGAIVSDDGRRNPVSLHKAAVDGLPKLLARFGRLCAIGDYREPSLARWLRHLGFRQARDLGNGVTMWEVDRQWLEL